MSTKLKDILKESWIGGFVSENAFTTEEKLERYIIIKTF